MSVRAKRWTTRLSPLPTAMPRRWSRTTSGCGLPQRRGGSRSRRSFDWHGRTRELELLFNRQQAHDIDHEPLPPAGPGISVELRFRPVGLRRPHQAAIVAKRDAVGAAGRDPLIYELSQLPGNFRAIDHDADLGVDESRARVEVEAADEYRLAVEHQGLGVQGCARLARHDRQ